MKKLFYWPKLKESVLEYVKQCDICQMNKHENIQTPRLLESIPVPDGAWEIIIMNFVIGLPKSDGKNILMVVIDKFIK